jgi:hypothetical protein
MPKQTALGLLVAATLLGSTAFAQTKGPNGGVVTKAEGHPIEFVNSGQEIVFYFSDDDGTPMSMKGVEARAVVQDGGKTTTVPLAAVEPNKMVGKLQASLNPGARVVVSAKLHGHSLQARFTNK